MSDFVIRLYRLVKVLPNGNKFIVSYVDRNFELTEAMKKIGLEIEYSDDAGINWHPKYAEKIEKTTIDAKTLEVIEPQKDNDAKEEVKNAKRNSRKSK
jgi:hypothetical protein